MIKVKSDVTVYEINGEETHGLELPTIEVKSDPIFGDRVVLVVRGVEFQVLASDLTNAIANATRTGR